MFVYLLRSSRKMYIGATVDLERRLRQHNGEVKGGAKATRGRKWKRVAYISGFPNWKTTLAFEWKWKQLSRKQKAPPLTKQFEALHILLGLYKPTSHAIPFCQWKSEPIIHFEL